MPVRGNGRALTELVLTPDDNFLDKVGCRLVTQRLHAKSDHRWHCGSLLREQTVKIRVERDNHSTFLPRCLKYFDVGCAQAQIICMVNVMSHRHEQLARQIR
jgi:hypothetical protein